MQPEEVKAVLASSFEGAEIEVEVNGSHYDILIVSEVFEGLRAVKKQQMVYAAINEHIASGDMHAVNMRLFTPSQWAEQNA